MEYVSASEDQNWSLVKHKIALYTKLTHYFLSSADSVDATSVEVTS